MWWWRVVEGTDSVGNAPQGNRERDANAAQRSAEAYKLWLRGWSFRRIAAALGYANPGAAHKAWKRAHLAQLVPVEVEVERERERERLEIAYAGIAERVEAGDHWSIDRAVAIAERKAKLLGLDAQPDALRAAANYTKRVILEDSAPKRPEPATESESAA